MSVADVENSNAAQYLKQQKQQNGTACNLGDQSGGILTEAISAILSARTKRVLALSKWY